MSILPNFSEFGFVLNEKLVLPFCFFSPFSFGLEMRSQHGLPKVPTAFCFCALSVLLFFYYDTIIFIFNPSFSCFEAFIIFQAVQLMVDLVDYSDCVAQVNNPLYIQEVEGRQFSADRAFLIQCYYSFKKFQNNYFKNSQDL